MHKYIQTCLFPECPKDIPLSPFPGSKRKYTGLFFGHKTFSAHIEPFLGGGALAIASKSPCKYVAEANPALQAQWRLIVSNQWTSVLSGLAFWQQQVRRAMNTGYDAYLALTPRHRRDEAKEVGGDALDFMYQMDEVWDRLLSVLGSKNPITLAIASLAIRKLGFQSTVRKSKSGFLNIAWSVLKVGPFVRFCGQQPAMTEHWRLYDDAFKAIQAFNSKPIGSAIAIVDPPYWLPWVHGVRNQMTPAYEDHQPHADTTFQLGVGALRQCAQSTAIERIVYCNYWSDPMHAAVMEVASKTHQIETHKLAVLDKKGQRIDHAWILERGKRW